MAKGAKFSGNNNALINEALKVWVKPTNGSVMVCGLIGPGTSRTITARYSEPFAQSSQGAMFDKTASLEQLRSKNTSITALNTALVWEGNEPYAFTVGMIFYATHNAFSEVMQPLFELEKMMAPRVNSDFPINLTGIGDVIGRVPQTVTLNIGRKLLIKDCVIESMSTPLDKERDSQGNLIRAEIQLQIKTQRMQTYNDVYGRGI